MESAYLHADFSLINFHCLMVTCPPVAEESPLSVGR